MEIETLKGKRVGVVLSGGGAKGAYQIGMFRALEEYGLEKENLILSGTSIGAMNALLYVCYGTDKMREFIVALGTTFRGFGNLIKDVDDARNREKISDELMKIYYSDGDLENNSVPVTVCAFSSKFGKPIYYKITGMDPEKQRRLVLASGSLPGFLPPVSFEGDKLSDGGKLIEGCAKDARPDKVPVKAMKTEDIDILIVNYLKPEDKEELSFLKKDILIIEIRPENHLKINRIPEL